MFIGCVFVTALLSEQWSTTCHHQCIWCQLQRMEVAKQLILWHQINLCHDFVCYFFKIGQFSEFCPLVLNRCVMIQLCYKKCEQIKCHWNVFWLAKAWSQIVTTNLFFGTLRLQLLEKLKDHFTHAKNIISMCWGFEIEVRKTKTICMARQC